MMSELLDSRPVVEWTVEWSPTPSQSWNWHIKSVHNSLESAESALAEYLSCSHLDSDPTHWDIRGWRS